MLDTSLADMIIKMLDGELRDFAEVPDSVTFQIDGKPPNVPYWFAWADSLWHFANRDGDSEVCRLNHFNQGLKNLYVETANTVSALSDQVVLVSAPCGETKRFPSSAPRIAGNRSTARRGFTI